MEVNIFALLFSLIRRKRQKSFNLVPNCLLTRWPILFVTGARSIFYYNSYWNLYPVFLAEHGYEVFNLSLPWTSLAARKKCFQIFLKQQLAKKKCFHLVLDYPSFKEFEKIVEEYSQTTFLSVSVVTDETTAPNCCEQIHPFSKNFIKVSANASHSSLAYKLHLYCLSILKHQHVPSLATLGGNAANSVENSLILLRRAQELAEKDFYRD